MERWEFTFRKEGNVDRWVIVSNRLPVSVIKKEGRLQFQPSTGGLATGLGSFYKSYQSLWVGWPGIALGRMKRGKEEIEEYLLAENCYPVFLSQYDVENYYYGFCNRTLWPLFHYFTQYTAYNKRLREAYKRVNKTFCEAVIKVIKPNDIIWVHDYHLMLLPQLIRERLPDATIGFFLHIPFPSFEIFQLLPGRREILNGILGADLIGFHTYDYVLHFLASIRHLLGYEHSFGQITAKGRTVRVDAFPMGIDYEKFVSAVHRSEVQKEIKKIHKKVGETKIILSLDRLDYTKGIPERLEAFDIFLERNPEYKEKVSLILVAVPSRTRLNHYMLLKRQIDEIIGRINGKYGTIGWTPVWYIYHSLPFYRLAALYNIAHVALVTPLRDGMNLIAKEFMATKRDGKGVLILSEMAGAAKELGEAILVNPNNKEQVAEALKEALSMSDEEQMECNRVMQKRLQRYNVVRWARDFIDKLLDTKKIQQELSARRLTHQMKDRLISDYSKSDTRLILLDYDGTLIPFFERPEKARPDDKLLGLLEALCNESRNEVVVISGRDKGSLEQWFGGLDIGLVAEHGVWVKEKRGTWEMIEPLRNDWKEQIRPILELYVDRTPGALLEEKEFSLVWHYRMADPELGGVRAMELKDALLHLTVNLNLGVLEGNKVIEIKNTGINKGRAALRWIEKEKWDFILAMGDDWTDEHVFSALPESAYSIKVGLGPSRANFNLDSVADIRSLLITLAHLSVGKY